MYRHPLSSSKQYSFRKLYAELLDAGIDCEGCVSIDDIDYIQFTIEPDQPTKDAVDSLAGAHNMEEKEYQIYQYVMWNPAQRWKPPWGVDYKTGLDRRLHPEHTFIKGELQKTVYYEQVTLNPDGSQTFAIPVLQVEFVWHRQPVTTFVYLRESTICWYFVDGTLDTDASHAKRLQKFYNNDESIKEGIRRRANIVDSLKLTNFGLLQLVLPDATDGDIIDLGRQWLEEYSETLRNYIDAGDIQGLVDRMGKDTTYWMRMEIPGAGITIAQYLSNEVTL